jgi:hypothetical protein
LTVFLCLTLAVFTFASATFGFVPVDVIRDILNAKFDGFVQVNYTEVRHEAMSMRLWIVSFFLLLLACSIWLARVQVNAFGHQFGQDFVALWNAALISAKRTFLEGGVNAHFNLIVLFIVGGAIRIWFIDAPMGFDEGNAYYAAKQPLLLTLINQWAVHQVMAIWGIKITTWIFGDTIWAIRISMLIVGFASIFLTYWAAVVWSNHNVGALAAAGVAIAWPLVTYSVSARGYSFATFLFVLMLSLLPYLARTHNKVAVFIFASTMALSVYSVQTMVFPCIGLVIFLGYRIFMESDLAFELRFRLVLVTCSAIGIGGAILTFVLLGPFLLAHGIAGLTVSQTVFEGKQALPFLKLLSSQIGSTLETWIVDLPVLIQFLFGAGILIGLLVTPWSGVLMAALLVSVFPIFFIIGEFAPPPRIWQFLLPAILLVAAIGIVRVLTTVLPTRGLSPLITVLVCVITFWTGFNSYRSESVIYEYAGRVHIWVYEAAERALPFLASGDLLMGKKFNNPGLRYETEQRLARKSLRLVSFRDKPNDKFAAFRVCPKTKSCTEGNVSNAYYITEGSGEASVEPSLNAAGIKDYTNLKNRM